MGDKRFGPIHRDALPLMGLEHSMEGAWSFYDRMDDLGVPKWRDRADDCARALRLYAEKYHGHEKPQPVMPNWRAMMAAPVIPDHVKSEDACHV